MTTKKDEMEGFDPSRLTPAPRGPAVRSEEDNPLSKEREPTELYLKDEDVPQHLRANNPPPKDTAMPGTRSVNENTATYTKMLDGIRERKAEEAIAEAQKPAAERVAEELRGEYERMTASREAREVKSASEKADKGAEAS